MRGRKFSPGDRFGRWTVISQGAWRGEKRTLTCSCECGATLDVYACHLISGKSQGCLQCAVATHGMSHTPAWESWEAMLARCTYDKHPHYMSYGGRGITVCPEWSEFEAFHRDMGARPEGTSLDRINGDLGYYKENCKWSTHKEQQNNLSSNRIVWFDGTRYTLAQLAEHLGLNYHTLRHRIARGSRLDAPLRTPKPARVV